MAAVPVPKLQIAIKGPAGTTFPSFASTDLAGGDLQKIVLSNVRNKCNISTKLHFTADGVTRLEDQVTLEYYMSLTVEGSKILKSHERSGGASTMAADAAPGKDTKGGAALPPTANVATFVITVLDSTPAVGQPRALPETNATLAKLLDQARKVEDLKPGALPAFSNTELVALSGKYGPAASSTVWKEPGEMTEMQWDAVLKNTRALHGYYHDATRGILVKAPRPAFRLRGMGKPGTAGEASNEQPSQYYPSIPPFFISDDASVKVTEIQFQDQKTLLKQGFNSTSVSGSLGGGMKIPLTVSAALDDEHSWSRQERSTTSVDSLTVTYNFPRVVVEFETNDLEMTPECALQARRATSQSDADFFYRTYGNVFVTSLTLGGFLLSTRNVSKEEQATLDQVKDQVRKAAGLSFQAPSVSGSIGVANTQGTSSSQGGATLTQQASIAWDACGGNTLLAASPTEWVNTVKDYRLWRLMDQKRVVQLIGLVRSIDMVAYQNLTSPNQHTDAGRDPITDAEYNQRIRVLVLEAEGASDPQSNRLLRDLEDKYVARRYGSGSGLDEYLAFLRKNYPGSSAAVIQDGAKFGSLTLNQKVYFALFLASKGEMDFN